MVSCSTEKNLSTNLRKPRISSFHQYDGLKRANATEIENHNIVSNEHYSSEIKIANNQSIEASNEIASLNDMKTVDAEPLSEDESFENRPSILQNQLFQNKLDESSNYKNDKVQSNSVKKKVDNEGSQNQLDSHFSVRTSSVPFDHQQLCFYNENQLKFLFHLLLIEKLENQYYYQILFLILYY
jgi:hypothetical protein